MIRLSERSGSYLPTASEHHLLRAALLADADQVQASLRAWESVVDLDAIGRGPFRLFPLLHRNLSRHGIASALSPRLKGIYRKTWLHNQIIVEHGLAGLRILRRADIPVLLLKGAALVASTYEESALRPMDDFDLLVPREHFRRAVDLLEADGWQLTPPVPDRESYFAFRHAVGFARDTGSNLDLHWSAIRDCFDEEGEREFWSGSIPARLSGEDVRVLAPPDQILQICAHACIRNQVSPIRWVADAVFVLSRAGDMFDWDRLVKLARVRGLSYTIRVCLEYLRDGLGADIPVQVLHALRRDSKMSSRIAFAMRHRGGVATYAYLGTLWMRLAFLGKLAEAPGRLRLLPRYVHFYFGVDQARSLPLYLAKRFVRHVIGPARPAA